MVLLSISEIHLKIHFSFFTLLWIMLKNGQTCFENLVAVTLQDFESMYEYFSI